MLYGFEEEALLMVGIFMIVAFIWLDRRHQKRMADLDKQIADVQRQMEEV